MRAVAVANMQLNAVAVEFDFRAPTVIDRRPYRQVDVGLDPGRQRLGPLGRDANHARLWREKRCGRAQSQSTPPSATNATLLFFEGLSDDEPAHPT
jgi:hypothetical protein